jgi:hypothetical protein
LQNIENFLHKLKKVRQVSAAQGGVGPSGARLGGREIRLEALEADGRRKQKLSDEEQGRKSANSFF